jgi:hypothetical protein
MSAKINGIVIALDTDVSIEYAEQLCQSFKMMKNVLDAKPNVSIPADWIAESRVRHELGMEVLKFIKKGM